MNARVNVLGHNGNFGFPATTAVTHSQQSRTMRSEVINLNVLMDVPSAPGGQYRSLLLYLTLDR